MDVFYPQEQDDPGRLKYNPKHCGLHKMVKEDEKREWERICKEKKERLDRMWKKEIEAKGDDDDDN